MADANALGALNDKVRELKRSFHSLQPREQNLITALAVVVLIALIYLLLMHPAINSVASASKKLEAKQSLVQWMKANEDAARAASKATRGRSTSNRSQDILGAVNNAASRHNITLQRYEPEGKNKLRVWLEDASFNGMVRWLHQLESRNGITVASISLDAEKEPGLISAKIVLKN